MPPAQAPAAITWACARAGWDVVTPLKNVPDYLYVHVPAVLGVFSDRVCRRLLLVVLLVHGCLTRIKTLHTLQISKHSRRAIV